MTEVLKFKGFFPYIIVVFLNAFIDLGHKIVIQNTVFKIYDGQEQIILTAIVNALILLPFILLFSPAGYCSDKYPKNKVIRLSAFVAVIITSCITLFYYLGWFWPAFAMTFLLALQSAIYSPAKYGFIKELVGKNNLASANGLVQATTTIAILAGIFVFSILFEKFLTGMTYDDTHSLLMNIAPIGWALIALSIVELLFAYYIPQKHSTNEVMKFDIKKYINGEYLRNNINVVVKHKVIIHSIAGLSLFWAISQVMLAAFPAYAKETMQITNTVIIQGTMACAGIGIMFGAIIAGRLSRDHIETSMIPIGASGIALCLFILPSLGNEYMQAINFLVWGMFGGFLLVPLNTLIQFFAEENELGCTLAGSNFFQNCTMLSFLCLTVIFALNNIDSLGLFTILLIVAVSATAYTLYNRWYLISN